MPNDRFFAPETLTHNTSILLPDEESRHLTRVMRVQPEETIEVVNGQGQLAKARFVELKKHQALLNILEVHQEPKPPYEVILAQAMPRLPRLDTIVEKGTELGMTQLWLFAGQRSEKKELSNNQQERIYSLTIAALKQCGRLYLPTVSIKPSLKQWDSLPYPAFFGDISEDSIPFRPQSNNNLIFFIDPEGGFTPEEVSMMRKLSAKGVRLHPNILRTDTAAIVALTLASHSNH